MTSRRGDISAALSLRVEIDLPLPPSPGIFRRPDLVSGEPASPRAAAVAVQAGDAAHDAAATAAAVLLVVGAAQTVAEKVCTCCKEREREEGFGEMFKRNGIRALGSQAV